MVYDKIIFVCTGNTCRSPMAEYVMKNSLKDCEGRPEIISRGIAVFPGEPMNPKTAGALEINEIPYQQRSAQALSDKDLDGQVLILTMTQGHKRELERTRRRKAHLDIYTIKEFAGESGDVKDPYGMPERTYDLCFLEIDRLIGKVIDRLREDG